MSRVRITVFLAVLSLILFLANLAVVEAVASIFSLSASGTLLSLGVVLGVLSASFIAASVLGSRYYNAFTRGYYWLAAVWMGLFLYLLIASAIYGVAGLLLPHTAAAIIGQILLMIALALSVYGVIHTKSIRVTKVALSLERLPETWRGKQSVWVSDVHLGQVNGSAFARKVVEKIKTLSPDIIFIGGDLYDGTVAPDPSMLVLPLKELRAPHGVYFITGNHEEYGHEEKFIKAIKDVGIKVLQDQMVTIDGLQIIGADYHNTADRDRFRDLLTNLNIDPAKASILLKHEPRDLDIARDTGISLQISGHTHKAQLWPLNYVADLMYKGFSYGLHKLGEMHVYTSSGVGTWGPPMRVGSKSEVVRFTFN